MLNFDTILDNEGKEHLIIDSNDNDNNNNNQEIGDALKDFEILNFLGKGGFGEVYKVSSKKIIKYML